MELYALHLASIEHPVFSIFSYYIVFFFKSFLYIFKSLFEILFWFFAVQGPVRSFVVFVEGSCFVVQVDPNLMILLRTPSVGILVKTLKTAQSVNSGVSPSWLPFSEVLPS